MTQGGGGGLVTHHLGGRAGQRTPQKDVHTRGRAVCINSRTQQQQ